MKRKILLIVITFIFFGCKKWDDEGSQKIQCENCVIDNSELAVDVAEVVLFDKFGKMKIISQRPYKVKIEKDTIWNISGSVGILGGVFDIKISSTNGAIIDMNHGK